MRRGWCATHVAVAFCKRDVRRGWQRDVRRGWYWQARRGFWLAGERELFAGARLVVFFGLVVEDESLEFAGAGYAGGAACDDDGIP